MIKVSEVKKQNKWSYRKYLIPENLDLTERLNKYGYSQFTHERIIINLYWVIHLISKAWDSGKVQRNSFVNIPSTLFKRQLGDRDYSKYLSILEEIGVLERNNRYMCINKGHEKNFCKSFKLTKEFWDRKFVVLTIKTSKRISNKDKSKLNGLVEVGIYQNIRQLAVDERGYAEIMPKLSPTKRIVAEKTLNKVKNGIVNIKRGENSRRLFSTICAIPKDARQCLIKKDGGNLVELDVKSCFPTLLFSFYHKQKRKSEEAMQYINALRGDFYSVICGETVRGEKRDAVKKDFQRFLARHLHYKSVRRIEENFKAQFPYLYRKINSFERKNEITLNLHLQNLEASIMMDTVCRSFVESNLFIIPIHDGLIVENSIPAQFAIERAFEEKLGIFPKIKSECITNWSEIL